jgi:hypothetical protein
MEGPAYAGALVEASFNFGGVTPDFKAHSINGVLYLVTGLSDGDLAVSIPAASVVPYQLDLHLYVDAASECTDSGCGVTDTPEPGTPLLLFPAVVAVVLKVGRGRKTIKARDGCTARTHPPVPAECSPERRQMFHPLPRPR